IALTKLDVLSYMDNIPVCIGYEIDGNITNEFPFTPLLNKAEPVYEVLKGWQEDISKVRLFSELPKTAQDYVQFIENTLESPIKYVSVGPERESLIIR
ncbi:MAG TPA: adenylosuccinate synthetase, partial [Clostridia bacterium]|nr:adenylosuccinate synthetase [Clostridia bacterium]